MRDWLKAEVTLTLVTKMKKANRGPKAGQPELEEQVVRWVLEQRTAGKDLCSTLKTDPDTGGASCPCSAFIPPYFCTFP